MFLISKDEFLCLAQKHAGRKLKWYNVKGYSLLVDVAVDVKSVLFNETVDALDFADCFLTEPRTKVYDVVLEGDLTESNLIPVSENFVAYPIKFQLTHTMINYGSLFFRKSENLGLATILTPTTPVSVIYKDEVYPTKVRSQGGRVDGLKKLYRNNKELQTGVPCKLKYDSFGSRLYLDLIKE
ncbi:hypothetical protein D3C71_1349400 [compost metagenome]